MNQQANSSPISRTEALPCLGICLALFCSFYASNAYADTLTNPPSDFVAFFKKAISSPPDVERYTASQHSIGSATTTFFVGARAGSNYTLQILSDSNEFHNLIKTQNEIIVGRSGTNAYQVGQDKISFGIGSNGLTLSVEMLSVMTRQLLDMGMSEIEPDTVKWTDNTFTSRVRGYSRYGALSISNGIPFRLEISNAKGSVPYKMVEYTYPDSAGSLDGFPSKMEISTGPNGELKPVNELYLYSVKSAARPLSNDFFSATQYLTIKTIHTNFYSNSDLYVANRLGLMVKVPNSVGKTGGYTNSRARTLVFAWLVLATLAPIIFFVLLRNKQTKKQEIDI